MTAARACQEPGCTGEIAPDGYCDTCGAKARPPRPPRPMSVRAGGAPAAARRPRAPDPVAAPDAPDADALADGDGAAGRRLPFSTPAAAGAGSGSRGSHVSGSARSGSRRQTRATRTGGSRRTAIGAGLVDVPPAPPVDPDAVILADPTVAENKRFCSNCGSPVGRSRDGSPGRSSGFCPTCRNPFDFVPKLRRGEIVGRQYEVMGCLAHGGLGWIYLARDKAVNDRWVVLKGLLDSGDQAAMAVAVAERRFLAELDHPAIVVIYNFVTDRGA
ncbi:MAG: serine/threonine-protein kinase PknG, partial [Actinomycetota bacterium]|nr:serine/threonine-protein kinase PknG [Actinomycetota bacterium]